MTHAEQLSELRTLQAALRLEAESLRLWPDLAAQQLHRRCHEAGPNSARLVAAIETFLSGRRWCRWRGIEGRVQPICSWSLGRGAQVVAVRFTADGKGIVAVSGWRWALWSLDSAAIVSEAALASGGPRASCADLAAAADRLGLGHVDGTCSIWELSTGHRLAEWRPASQPVGAIALSADAETIATYTKSPVGGCIRIWRATGGEPLAERHVDTLASSLKTLAPRLSDDGVSVVSGVALDTAAAPVALAFLSKHEICFALPGCAEIWDWHRGTTTWRDERGATRRAGGLLAFERGFVGATILAGIDAVAFVDAGGTLARISPTQGTMTTESWGDQASWNAAAIAGDGATIVALNARREARVFRRGDRGWVGRPIASGELVDLVGLSPGSEHLLVAVEDRCAVYRPADILGISSTEKESKISAASFTRDGQGLLLGGYGYVSNFQIRPHREIWRRRLSGARLTALDWSRDKKWFAAGTEDGACSIWRTDATEPAARCEVRGEAVLCARFSYVADCLALGTAAGEVALWEWQRSAAPQRRLAVIPGSVTAIAWAGRKMIAVAGESSSIWLINVSRMKVQSELAGHQAWVSCLTYSSASGILASGSWDGTVRFWTLDGLEAHEPVLIGLEVVAVALLGEGRIVAAVDGRGQCQFWNMNGQRLGRCLFPEPPVTVSPSGEATFGYVNASREVVELCLEGPWQSIPVVAPRATPRRAGWLGRLLRSDRR